MNTGESYHTMTKQLATTDFSIEMVDDTLLSNYYDYLGSGSSYAKLFPSKTDYVEVNWGLFRIFCNGSNQLYQGHMYVDVYRANETEPKHLLRKELTQSLGLAKDSPLYPESIFQQSFSTKTT